MISTRVKCVQQRIKVMIHVSHFDTSTGNFRYASEYYSTPVFPQEFMLKCMYVYHAAKCDV
jgi:indole-3-glycerol phosphate synthase